eukprot:gene15956-18970_t
MAGDTVEQSSKKGIEEAIARGWDIPNFTIKEIRDAIPPHCFERDTLRSLSYVAHDFFFIAVLAFLATYIDTFSSFPVRAVLWIAYWIAQGIVGTGVWVIGHECGHQSFSDHKIVNNGMGMFLHTLLLVPFHSWKYSHSKHHKGTGSMERDEVFVPHNREFYGMPSKGKDPKPDGPHSMLDDSPIKTLLEMVFIFTLGWPIYLLTHIGGQKYSGPWISHFNPTCGLFDKNQFWDVVQSVAGIGAMVTLLARFSQAYGVDAMIKYYFIPYLMVNFWLVLITYLHHTDPKMPHYREALWNFQRGAALTVDRSYGTILNYFHHHISDTHVAHHFFSTMPHYHAEEATKHIKKALGKHYIFDPTPIPQALWKSWTQCKYVEDDGDIVFYKH